MAGQQWGALIDGGARALLTLTAIIGLVSFIAGAIVGYGLVAP